MNHPDLAMVDVVPRDEKDSRRRPRYRVISTRGCAAFRPGFERVAQAPLHRGGIEVSGDRKKDVVRVHVLPMPREEILARDRGDRRVLRHARIWARGAVAELSRLPGGDRT